MVFMGDYGYDNKEVNIIVGILWRVDYPKSNWFQALECCRLNKITKKLNKKKIAVIKGTVNYRIF
jgi:hypothetical protein